MIRTHAIRGILIGNSGLKRVRFANIDPNAIEDIILLELGFANTNTALADDYTIVPLGFANIDAEAMDDP
jgi:hypothetical protein